MTINKKVEKVAKMIIKGEFSDNKRTHYLDEESFNEVNLDNQVLFVYQLDKDTKIIICLDSNKNLVLCLDNNGRQRYLAIKKETSQNSDTSIEYGENNNSISFSPNLTGGVKHVLKASNLARHETTVNYKVELDDTNHIQAAIIGYPRVREFLDFFLETINRINPTIKKFLYSDLRFARLLKLKDKSKKPDTNYMAYIEYLFLCSGMLEDRVELPKKGEVVYEKKVSTLIDN